MRTGYLGFSVNFLPQGSSHLSYTHGLGRVYSETGAEWAAGLVPQAHAAHPARGAGSGAPRASGVGGDLEGVRLWPG